MKTPKTLPEASREGDARFAAVLRAFAAKRDVSRGKMFGAVGLKVKGRVFAMVVKGKFVVKLPKARVDALVAAGTGEYFDPGHGRLMKEWVAVASTTVPWVQLAREAHRFVQSGAR